MSKQLDLARHVLADAYDLTPRQADLVVALALGVCLKDYSEQVGIQFSTARSILKQVFSKTDTHHQGGLISEVLRGPAGKYLSNVR